MLRKSSSHFIAHVVTAFVNRLSEAIHEVAAVRAHSEVLAALGGFAKHGKHAGRSRPLRANKKETDVVETEKTAKRVAKRTPKKTAKTTAKKTAKMTAKTTAKTTSQMAAAKSTPQPTTKKVRARAKPATRAKAATSTALAPPAMAKRKDSRPPIPTRTQGATPEAGALIPTEPPAAREAPALPPEPVVASADAASATAG